MDNHIPSAKDIVGSSPLIAIANEPPAKLIVDPQRIRDVHGARFEAVSQSSSNKDLPS